MGIKIVSHLLCLVDSDNFHGGMWCQASAVLKSISQPSMLFPATYRWYEALHF